jgi:2-polyprenyl-3-methyl-5-hydroxy-6-metoxy-1,4-benzoquinol methylase
MKDQKAVSRHFDDFAQHFDGFYSGQRSSLVRWMDRHFRRDIYLRFALTFESFGKLTGKNILDIGCGSGPYMLECLRRDAEHVTGVDPAPGMLELAQGYLEKEYPNSRFKLIESTFPGIDPSPHDHVIVMGVMDYIADPLTFLSTLRPLVKVSTAISFPSKHWLRTPLRRVRYWLKRCPLFLYSEEDISSLLEKSGFTEVHIEKIQGAGMDFHVIARP